MGRYLLLEFDDNDSADRMRAQIDNAEANGKAFRVIGVWGKPARLCDCAVRSESSLKGSRWGWWVCPVCRRPKAGSPQSMGNRLDHPDTPAKYREIFLALRWFLRDGKVITARSVPKKDWK